MTVSPIEPKLLLTAWEAAYVLNISRETLYQRMRAGEIEGVKVAGKRLFRRAALEAYIESLATGGSAE